MDCNNYSYVSYLCYGWSTLMINFLIDAGKKRGYTYAYNFVTTCVIVVIDKISVSNIEFDRTWRYGNLLGGSQWMICER